MIFRLGLPSPKEVNNMATREFLFHSTMEEGYKEARMKRRHRGGTVENSRVNLLLLTSALVLVNVGAEPQGAGEPIPVTYLIFVTSPRARLV